MGDIIHSDDPISPAEILLCDAVEPDEGQRQVLLSTHTHTHTHTHTLNNIPKVAQ